MKSQIVKRAIWMDGRQTSISLEDVFWCGLKEIATARHATLSELLVRIDDSRDGNLSSAIRIFVFDYFHDKAVKSGRGPQPRTIKCK
jgi:predicted DNA-binding ribbon-helix-helix protein